MVTQNKRPSAFKHGAYSKTDILPGEDAVAFNKLRDDVVAEFRPHGAIEESIVSDLARLYWRKNNMATYRLAELARSRCSEIVNEMNPDQTFELALALNHPSKTREEILAQKEAAEEQAREELGEAFGLTEIGKLATIEYLLKELSVGDRLDGMIDRALKRLLLVRGIKRMGTLEGRDELRAP